MQTIYSDLNPSPLNVKEQSDDKLALNPISERELKVKGKSK